MVDQPRQAGAGHCLEKVETICIKPSVAIDAIEAELIDHFSFSSVEGLVRLEAGSIAARAFERLVAAQKPQSQSKAL